MNNNRQSKGIKKSSRILASLMALLMITALILPMGAKASETADGSASGASQAVAEEHTEKEEEKDSSDSDAKNEEEEKAEAAETEEKEQKSDSSADTASEDSSDAKSESKEEKEDSKDESGEDAAQKSKEEAGGSDQTSGKGASGAEEDKDAGKSSNTDQRDSEKTDSGNKSGKTDAAQEKDAASGKSVEAGTDAGTSEETSGQVTAAVENDETTITFQTEEVTVIADKKAFDTEVTMKVKKVTDPGQLLKMVTVLQDEGGSYTVKAYNVSFYDQNGKEVEPKIPVQVNVNTKVSAPKKTKVVHVKDNDKTEILDADIDRSGASFELGSFSDIGVATEGKAKIPGSSFDLYLGDELTTDYTVDDLPAGPISEKDLPAVDGYTYENATVGEDQVEEIGTITDEEGNVYVYYTTRDENGTIKAEILGDGRIRINLVETDQDTTYDLEVDGTRVRVEAPADAFDEGTYMEIQTIELDDAQSAQVKEQAAQVLGEDAQMKIQAVDISFYDRDGHKVQPRQTVKVDLTTPQAVEGDFCVVNLGDTIYRVDAQISNDGNIYFSTDSFFVYAVVGTVIEKNVLASDGNNYHITVTCEEGSGIPENADLDVKELLGTSENYDEYVAKTENALGMEEGSAGYIRLFDISIVNKDDHSIKYQPSEGKSVAVQIELADSKSDELNVVHFSDESDAGSLVDADTDGQTVNFEANGFSVYAVIGEGETGEEARLKVVFHGADDQETIFYVKTKDGELDEEDFNVIVYDPGAGTLDEGVYFKGWSIDNPEYTTETENKTIDDVRDYIKTLLPTVKEGDTLDVYAMLFKQYTVKYLDQKNAVIGTHTVEYRMDDTAEFQNYTVNMSYTPPDDEHAFQGWFVKSGPENIEGYDYSANDGVGSIYDNATDISIKGDVVFSVNAPAGHWLIFDENGKGAKYNAPKFIKSGEVTAKPCDDSEMIRKGYTFGGWYADKECTTPFTFGGEINTTTTVYAKWDVKNTVPYTVIIWKQNVQGNGYDFEESIQLSGTPDTIIDTVTAVGSNTAGYAEVDGTEKPYTGFHLKEFDQNVKIAAEGGTVLNIYYDRNEYTLTFKTSNTYSVEYKTISGYNLLRVKNGSNYTYAIQIDGKWYRITSNGSYVWNASRINSVPGSGAGNYIGYRYNSRNYEDARINWTEYTIPADPNIIKTITALYEQDISGYFPIVGTNGVNYSGWVWDPQNSEIFTTGQVPSLEIMPAESTTFLAKRYGDRQTAHLYYYLEALPGSSGTVTYNGKQFDLHQHVEVDINSTVNSTKSEDFYDIDGFTQWASNPVYGSNGTVELNSSNNRTIRFYYTRDSYIITYMDGIYVDGNGNPLTESSLGEIRESQEILYDAPIPDQDKTYEPIAPSGYVFEGWYIDETCTHPWTPTTMPKANLVVYAKWRKIEYRVFLHPNAGTDPTLDWGSENQAMNFRVGYGEKISTPTGLRDGYEFVGWYLNDACTQMFNADAFVLNDSTVTTPYDKTTDFTDVMDKWGNSATWNSDAQDENGNPIDRFWITKKLDLYAKWRQTLDGAAGIGVIYDANGGSNAPTDPYVYEDTSTAVAGAASSAPEGDDVFLYWVIQKWNNTSGQYEDVTEAGSPLTVKPGGDFTVLKDYAKVIVTQWCNPSNEDDVIDVPSDQQTPGNTAPPDNTHTKIKAATYTMQLRAEYGQPGQPENTTTHIYWYANNDEGTYSSSTTPYKSDTDIAINQAVNIPDVPSYEGHEFKGWAKLNEGVVTGYPTAWDDMTNAQQNTFNNNMFLTYDNGTYTYNGKDVTQVMADETTPYQDLYAVWEKKKYDVKIIKAVTSESEADKTREYSFTAIGVTNYSGGSSLSSFRLTDTGEKEVEDILYGETISFQETDVANYNVTISASYTDEAGIDHSVDIPNNNNNSVSYKVLGDTTITITNTRKVGDVDVTKIVSGNMGETDKNFSFTASIKDGQNSLKLIKADDGTIKVSQEGGEGSIHFNLTHEQTKQFKDLPVGAVLMIEEDEYGDYAQSYKIGEGSDQQSRAAQVTVNNGNTEIVFTNDKTVVAPTQLYSGTGPMAVLVVFSLGALILLAAHHFIDRFRHSNNM